jgi:hypothetical protein
MESQAELQAYLQKIQPGQRVVETGHNAFHQRRGLTYIGSHGNVCVLWDYAQDEDPDCGQMGTSLTGGTRLLADAGLPFDDYLIVNVINGPEHSLPLILPEGIQIKRIWTILDPKKILGPDRKPAPVHHANAFLEDQVHDWHLADGKLHYYSRTCEKGQWAKILIIL